MPTFESRNRHRRIAAALGALGVLALVVACAPETEPDPEPTGFATEEEALEAARETFESYVEATNAVDFSDLDTAEQAYEWLTKDALASAKQAYTESHAERTTRSGDSKITLVELREATLEPIELTVDACVDVSEVDVVDQNGESIVSADRAPIQAMQVQFVSSASTSTGLAISTTSGREGDPPCDDAKP
ncbi:hypothetical protein [Microbacterium sp.]|uniref:hypothetical protein n=1 Tax=Microbacterium sp. TaxID=51671 RepID=UPI003F9443AA